MRRFAILLAATLVGTPLEAQWRSYSIASTRGPFVAVQGGGTWVSVRELFGHAEFGGGEGLQAGYGFTPRLAIVVEGGRARIDGSANDGTVRHVDGLARLALAGLFRRALPYVEAGMSHRWLTMNDVPVGEASADLDMSGPAVTLGAGVHFFLVPQVAIGGAYRWTMGPMSTAYPDNEIFGNLGTNAPSSRVSAGATVYLRGPR